MSLASKTSHLILQDQDSSSSNTVCVIKIFFGSYITRFVFLEYALTLSRICQYFVLLFVKFMASFPVFSTVSHVFYGALGNAQKYSKATKILSNFKNATDCTDFSFFMNPC